MNILYKYSLSSQPSGPVSQVVRYPMSVFSEFYTLLHEYRLMNETVRCLGIFFQLKVDLHHVV